MGLDKAMDDEKREMRGFGFVYTVWNWNRRMLKRVSREREREANHGAFHHRKVGIFMAKGENKKIKRSALNSTTHCDAAIVSRASLAGNKKFHLFLLTHLVALCLLFIVSSTTRTCVRIRRPRHHLPPHKSIAYYCGRNLFLLLLPASWDSLVSCYFGFSGLGFFCDFASFLLARCVLCSSALFR